MFGRDSMRAQLGYVTAKIEELDKYVREHMIKEEDKFGVINQTILLQRRYLIGVTCLMVMDSSGLPINRVLETLLQLIF